MGGAVGSVVGSIVSSVLSSTVGNVINSLVSQFGLDDVFNSIMNLASDLLESGLGGIIDSLPLPTALKDLAKGVVGNVLDGFRNEVSPAAQDAVNEELGCDVAESVDGVLSIISSSMREEMESASESGNGNAGEHWLSILARALGKASGKHLEAMLELGDQMGKVGDIDEGNQAEFAEMQADFQAQSQIFKMFQESISTMLKSIGDGMSAVGRRQ